MINNILCLQKCQSQVETAPELIQPNSQGFSDYLPVQLTETKVKRASNINVSDGNFTAKIIGGNNACEHYTYICTGPHYFHKKGKINGTTDILSIEGLRYGTYQLSVSDCSNVTMQYSFMVHFPLQIISLNTIKETCPGDYDGAIEFGVGGGDDSCGEYEYSDVHINGDEYIHRGKVKADVAGYRKGSFSNSLMAIIHSLPAGKYKLFVQDCGGKQIEKECEIKRLIVGRPCK